MDINKLQVSIFGLGHIGLPTAAILANNKIKVLGADINTKSVENINKGICSFEEPGLSKLVKKTVNDGYLKATDNLITAAETSDILIVIVPTPVDKNNKADLSYVISACASIKKGLKKGNLVIIESTVPPCTGIEIVKPLLEESGLKCGEDFLLAYSPERALPHNTLYEMTNNVRVVGGYNKESTKQAAELYSHVTNGKIIEVKDITSAEMVKLMENTYRDVNIALSNEFAILCEKINVNAIDVINAANYHPRVNIHTPGPGVGGHCIPIDPYFLIELAKKYGITAPIIENARMTNNNMPNHVISLLLDNIDVNPNDYTVGILGVSYKGNVDDTRESPSYKVIALLNKLGFNVVAHDPLVSKEVINTFNAKSVSYKTALNSDCVILMTDHDVYKDLKPDMLPNKFIICTRPILDADLFRSESVNFQGIGQVVHN